MQPLGERDREIQRQLLEKKLAKILLCYYIKMIIDTILFSVIKLLN